MLYTEQDCFLDIWNIRKHTLCNGYHNWEMGLMKQVQTLNEAICISLCANALGKIMNLSLLFPAMDK